MTIFLKVCHSCAADQRDGARFRRRAPHQPYVCTDCVAEAIRPAPVRHVMPVDATQAQRRKITGVISRRAYRATLRLRAASDQLDLIDPIVSAP